MLKQIQVPISSMKGQGLWLLYCTGKNKLRVLKQGDQYYVISCEDEHRECYGCHPRGLFDFNPNNITEFKELVNSMQVSKDELDSYFITEEAIKKRLKPYKELPELYGWFRTTNSSDLDAVYIFKIPTGVTNHETSRETEETLS